MNSYHENHSDPEIRKKYWDWVKAANDSRGYPHKKPAKNFFGDSNTLVPLQTLMHKAHNANVRRMQRTGGQRGS
jgi:hypothetical protein